MIGAILNAAGIILGGVGALAFRKPIPALSQAALKIVLGVFALWFGLRLTWVSVNGSFRQIAKEMGLNLGIWLPDKVFDETIVLHHEPIILSTHFINHTLINSYTVDSTDKIRPNASHCIRDRSSKARNSFFIFVYSLFN